MPDSWRDVVQWGCAMVLALTMISWLAHAHHSTLEDYYFPNNEPVSAACFSVNELVCYDRG